MYHALHLSPMIPSANLTTTGSFFENVLGFSAVRDDPNYRILLKDDAMVHIAKTDGEPDLMECYLEIDDVDILWDSIKEKLDGVKTKAPFNQAYGMREVHIQIPGTNTILFIGHESR